MEVHGIEPWALCIESRYSTTEFSPLVGKIMMCRHQVWGLDKPVSTPANPGLLLLFSFSLSPLSLLFSFSDTTCRMDLESAAVKFISCDFDVDFLQTFIKSN